MLPRLTNQEFDRVVELAHNLNIDLNRCPTCEQPRTEVAPGVWIWAPSEYKYNDVTQPCDCEAQDNLRRHYLLAGIPRAYWTLSPDDFWGDEEALDATQQYLDKWESWYKHGWGIEFYSPTMGTGKTFLATLVARHAIKLGIRVHFTIFRDIIGVFQMPYEAREARIAQLRNTPVLALDEVGAGISDAQHNLFAAELEELIRFRTSGNNVTIITTNLRPEDLDLLYPRTYSLLAAKQMTIWVQGHDVRRAGDVNLDNRALIENGEARPIY